MNSKKSKSEPPLVLVIDDNEMNLKLMKGVMAFAGYRLEVARTAEEGLAKAAQIRADVVLMDIQLPEMDGYEATKILRRNPDYQNIPILAISGYAMDQNQDKLQGAGFDGYLQKPINVQNVIRILKDFLGPDAVT